MTGISHPKLVANLKKPGGDIVRSLSPQKADAWHMSSCIMGEAGELFDAIKKWVVYEGELDMENVVEELGDIEFYLEGLRQCLDIHRANTLAANIGKLSRRYHSGEYRDEHAAERADKNRASEVAER